MSSGGTTFVQPPKSQSSAAATKEAIQAEIELLPQRFETELEFAPKFAEVDLRTIQQFAPEIVDLGRTFAREERALQEELYPGQIAAERALAEKIELGLEEGIPPDVEEAFLDRFRSEEAVGGRLGSPVGSINVARKLAGLSEAFRSQRVSEGLSFAGKLPVVGSSQFNVSRPQTSPTVTGQTVAPQLGFAASTFGDFTRATSQPTTQQGFDIRRFVPPIGLSF